MLLQFIDNPHDASRDSVVQAIGHSLIDPTFKPIQDDLLATGNIKLISNHTLRRMLINWPSDVLTIQELEGIWQSYVQEEYMPLMVEMGLIRDIIHNYWTKNDQLWKLDKTDNSYFQIKSSTKHNASVEQLLSFKQLEGSAAIAISHNHGANLQSRALLKRIDEILEILVREIK